MPPIKAIAIDLDETLLTSDKMLAPVNIAAVQRAAAAGCRVILATARQRQATVAIAGDLGLDEPLICDNGARIYAGPAGPLWRETNIPMAVAERVCGLADAHGWEFSTLVGETNFLRQRPGQPLGSFREGFEVVANNSAALVAEPTRIFTWDEPAIVTLHAICQNEFPTRCRADIFYEADGAYHSLGIFGAEADKGSALRFVLAQMGLQAQEVLAIGDNSNDRPMLELAGFAVAMGNATDEVKAMADAIAPTNDEGGVAWALDRFVGRG